MSFIAKSIYSFFSPSSQDSQSFDNYYIFQKGNNITNNDSNEYSNLFTTVKKTKKSKIFSTKDNENSGIFNFVKNNNNDTKDEINNINYIDNGFSRKIIFTDNNNEFNKKNDINKNKIKYKETSVGNIFNGSTIIKSHNQICVLMSITALPEFSHSSAEELRLADLEKKATGNVELFKINNTLNKKDFFSYDNGHNNNKDNKLFFDKENNLFRNNNIFKNRQNPLFNKSSEINNDNNNNKTNIFLYKLDNSKSPFVDLIKNSNNNNNNYNTFSFDSNNNKQNLFIKEDSLFKSNINNNINNKKDSFFTYDKFNTNLNSNYNNNFDTSTAFNNFYNFPSEQTPTPLNNFDIDKLFSQKEKLSKALNEAIQKKKSVKDFLLDLDKEYNSKSSEIININEQKNFDNGITLSENKNNNIINNKYSNDTPLYLSPIKIKNEIPFYTMKIEENNNNSDIYNYNNNSCSKIKQIYNDYETSKNDYNHKNYLGNKTFNKIKENFMSSKKTKLENDNFYKTFSNGFHKLKINSINNKDSTKNKKEILYGRDENLYKLNLLKIDNLCLNDIQSIEDENEDKDFKENEQESKSNQSLSNSLINLSKKKLNDSSSTISHQFADLIIKYKLPDDENKNYELYLNEIDQLMKIKLLKYEITSRLYEILKTNNYSNYSITKISLLTPTQILQDEDTLLSYHLNSNNYTIQAFINYKNLIPEHLLPKLDKPGYNCIPSISELQNKSLEEIKCIKNFRIFNHYGEVVFKEPVNLLGINLDEEIIIEKNMIETGDALDYWSIFKLYEFIANENVINNLKEKLKQNGGKFIFYKNKELIWEYKPS